MFCVEPPPGAFAFGPWKLDNSEVFFVNDHSFAFVNTKPLVPGHVLISPKRVVDALADLSHDELGSLSRATRLIGRLMQQLHGTTAWQATIQDGKCAGQTVPHLHVHIMPVNADSMSRLQSDAERVCRPWAEMNAEARAIAAYGARVMHSEEEK